MRSIEEIKKDIEETKEGLQMEGVPEEERYMFKELLGYLEKELAEAEEALKKGKSEEYEEKVDEVDEVGEEETGTTAPKKRGRKKGVKYSPFKEGNIVKVSGTDGT